MIETAQSLPRNRERPLLGRLCRKTPCKAERGRIGRTGQVPRMASFVQSPMAADEYLLWAISEGGADFGTDMPAFRHTLSRSQIWEIITYMRAGFPDGR